MKIFKTFFNSRTRKICFFLFFVLFLFLLYSVNVEAQSIDDIINNPIGRFIITGVGGPFGAINAIGGIIYNFSKNGITGVIFPVLYLTSLLSYAVANLTYYLAMLGVTVLNFVIDLGSSSILSYTHNPVVEAGLNITTSFVNMILVLALVFIALATILRIENYSAKKLLVRFIIIALIINFSSVITGVVIDASNIIMKFFLGSTKSSHGPVIDLWHTSTCNKGPEENGWNYDSTAEELVQKGFLSCALLNISFLFIFLVNLIFAFLFIFRFMILWILVILAPIAFACYVVPITQKFWEKWKNYFIHWCFIGVSAAFFLYLANATSKQIGEMLQIGELVSREGKGLATFGISVIAGIIPFLFYLIALFFALTTTVAGSEITTGVKKFGKTAGRGTLRWTGRQTIGRITSSNLYQKSMTAMAEGKWGASTLKQKASQYQYRNRWVKRAAQAGAALYGAATFLPSYATRRIGKAGMQYKYAQEEEIEKMMEKNKNWSPQDIAASLHGRSRFDYRGRIADARNLAAKGKKAYQSNTTSAEREEILRLAIKYNPSAVPELAKASPDLITDDIIKATHQKAPHLTADLVKIKPELILSTNPEVKQIIQNATGAQNMGDLIVKIKPEQFKNLDKSSYDSTTPEGKAFLEAFLAKGTREQMKQFILSQGKEGADEIEKHLRTRASQISRILPGRPKLSGGDYLKRINPKLHAYLDQFKGMINLT